MPLPKLSLFAGQTSALAISLSIGVFVGMIANPARAEQPQGLLFHAPLDADFDASNIKGKVPPNFRSGVSIVQDGAIGQAGRWSDGGYVAWEAPGNIYAQRGTLSFFWRSHTPVGEAPFVLFRVSAGDHSSWDMAFLRIDWNGHGFDAFVTDANLSRVRVSWTMPDRPSPDAWHHIAFSWDEASGVRLFWDGAEVAAKSRRPTSTWRWISWALPGE